MNSRSSIYFKEEDECPEKIYRDIVHARPAYGTIVRNQSRHDGVYPSTSNEAYQRDDTSEECSISGGSYLTVVADTPNGDMDAEELMYRTYKPLALKDFSLELRAHKDIDHYLCNTLLLLDVDESNTEDIVQLMIEQILEKRQPLVLNMANLMKSIFALNRDVLSKTIQGVRVSQMNTLQFDQSWICLLCEWPSKINRHTVIARLLNPVNMGSTSQEVSFVILVVASNKDKSTKSAVEIARTFCTIFADMDCRYRLHEAEDPEAFRNILKEETRMLFGKFIRNAKKRLQQEPKEEEEDKEENLFSLGQGIYDDLKKRLPHYRSDFEDGVCSRRAWRKVIPTTFFLYFACILPILAFGMLNESNTHGNIGLQNVLFGQCLGGIIFSLIGGQAMNILLTTAPLTLFTRVISKICDDFHINFLAMFACVGLWNSIFLTLYAVLDMCKLRKWSSRSSEEIFSAVVAFILFSDVMRDVYNNFIENYSSCNSKDGSANRQLNLTSMPYYSGHPRFVSISDPSQVQEPPSTIHCHRDISLLFLLLMLSTLWLTTTLSNFTKTPYLSAQKRQMLGDFALPLAIIIISAVSNIFQDIPMKPANVSSGSPFRIAPLSQLSPWAIVTAFFLGFSLSLLVFADQNISSSYISAPHYKLKKGQTYHWDLLVVAIINIPLSMFGCPWMHAAVTVSPFHVKSMAHMEDRVEQGDIHQIIVNVRETRVTSLLSHIMLGLSLLLLPWPIPIIPRPVLNGFLLYLGVTYLSNKQLIDRSLLLITEQGAYPPSHYIRRVPQREIHKYTMLQICQMLLLSFFTLVPVAYIQMFFPFGIISLVFIRQRLIPKVMENKHLAVLD